MQGQLGANELRIVVLNATYKQGCENAAPGDPQCKSATALDFEAKLLGQVTAGTVDVAGYDERSVGDEPFDHRP